MMDPEKSLCITNHLRTDFAVVVLTWQYISLVKRTRIGKFNLKIRNGALF